MKLGKKGFTEQDIVLVLVIALVLLLILGSWSGAFGAWFGGETAKEKCRLSVLANSEVRFRDVSFSGAIFGTGENDEKIAIDCPAEPPMEITYSDIRKKTTSGSAGAIKYALMGVLANELKECHEMYAGDVEGIVPFGEEKKTYCGICRKEVFFDDKIQKEVNTTNNFYTYLMNTKMPKTDEYFSEFLYDFKKTSDERVEFNSFFSGQGGFDLDINTSRKYYVVHLVVKDERSMDNFKNAAVDSAGTCGALSGGVAVASVILAPFSAGTSLLIGAAIGGASMMACVGQNVAHADRDYTRLTTIIPVDEFSQLQCEPYGLEERDV